MAARRAATGGSRSRRRASADTAVLERGAAEDRVDLVVDGELADGGLDLREVISSPPKNFSRSASSVSATVSSRRLRYSSAFS
jgi:hypothetical protein